MYMEFECVQRNGRQIYTSCRHLWFPITKTCDTQYVGFLARKTVGTMVGQCYERPGVVFVKRSKHATPLIINSAHSRSCDISSVARAPVLYLYTPSRASKIWIILFITVARSKLKFHLTLVLCKSKCKSTSVPN